MVQVERAPASFKGVLTPGSGEQQATMVESFHPLRGQITETMGKELMEIDKSYSDCKERGDKRRGGTIRDLVIDQIVCEHFEENMINCRS